MIHASRLSRYFATRFSHPGRLLRQHAVPGRVRRTRRHLRSRRTAPGPIRPARPPRPARWASGSTGHSATLLSTKKPAARQVLFCFVRSRMTGLEGGDYRVHPWWVMPLSWAGRLSRGSGPVPRSGRHLRGRDRCHDRCASRPDHAQAGFWADRVRGGKVSTGAFPGPLRHFLAQLDELRSADILDMDQVGRLLVELAADEEYLGPLIAEMPSESPGGSG